jgi:RHS repeat-associated protein
MTQANANNSPTNNTTYSYFFAGERSEEDDPLGNKHVLYNNPRGKVLQDIDQAGNITTDTYDAQDRLVTKTMPEGNTIAYTYDSFSNPLTVTQHAKPSFSVPDLVQNFTYIAPVAAQPNFTEVHTAQDANGNITTFNYDSTTGNLTEIDQPAVPKPGFGNVVPKQTFTYTAIGQLFGAIDAEGCWTRYEYDTSGNLVQIHQDFGNLNFRTQYGGYDLVGNPSTVKDPNGNVTTNHYDALRRLTEVDAPITGIVTTNVYDPDSRITSVTRANGANPQTANTAYTPSGKVLTVTDPAGFVTAYTYDLLDRQSTVTDAEHRQKTYTYDVLSRPFQVSDTSAVGGIGVLETYAHTPNGKELSFTNARNAVTQYAYDGFDRLAQTTYPDPLNSHENLAYDANGNVLTKTTRSGLTITFTYDALNRVQTKTPQGEAAGTVSYGYDLTGRLLQAADASSGSPYAISYDTAGRPSSYTDQLLRVVMLTHDAVGNKTSIAWPIGTNGGNGQYVVYRTYDALNRLTNTSDNTDTYPVLEVGHSWDPLSRLSNIYYHNHGTAVYTYDNDNNLVNLTHTDASNDVITISTTFNGAHQRLSTGISDSSYQFVPTVGSTSYSTANGDDTYLTVGSATLTYDGNRNLTFDGTNRLTYDVENRLVQAVKGGVTTTYLYDPLGHRKQKTVGTTVTQMVFDGDDEIEEYTPTKSRPYTLTVQGPGGRPDYLARTWPTPFVNIYDIIDLRLDGIGSAVSTTGSKTFSDKYAYGPFGEPNATSGVIYRFAGMLLDAETGLYYDKARVYDPAIGRFLQADPIGLKGGTNLYAYVTNDPINAIDPTGLWQVTISGGYLIGGAITFGHNSGQWSLGGYLGVGEGLQVAIDPNNSNPEASGFTAALSAAGGFELGKAFGVDVGGFIPIDTENLGGTSYQPQEFEGSLHAGSFSAGGTLSLFPDGSTSLSPHITTGLGASAYFGGGGIYRWGSSESDSAATEQASHPFSGSFGK